jgi:hypothetical protein
MYFPTFTELLLIGSGLGILVLILAYTQADAKDKEYKSKIKKYFLLLFITYLIIGYFRLS